MPEFCVLGASGFYGAQTVVALADLAGRYARRPVDGARPDGGDDVASAARAAAAAEAPPIVIVLAGRNPRKLDAMLPDLQRQADEALAKAPAARRRVRLEVLPVPVDVASAAGSGGGGGGRSNLRALALAAPVLLNCIRPVAYEWSERVMAACAREGRTAYLDLCARPAFLDAVRELFSFGEGEGDGGGGDGRSAAPPSSSSSSSPPPPPLVPGCGFDYALPDVATCYALRAYARRHASRPPARVRATFLVRTPPPPPRRPDSNDASGGGGGGGGGGFKLRLGAVDELLAPPQRANGGSGNNDDDDDGHRGWDPRRADVKAALERAAARRRALEARGLAVPPPRRPWLLREGQGLLAAGPRWTAPFFVGGGVEADLLRANLTEGGFGGIGEEEQGAPAPTLEFDCRIALPPPPSARALLLLLLLWPLLLGLLLPLLSALVGGALLARRSPRGGLVRALYLAALPYLTLGLVTADDAAARRSAERSVFERVCVLSGGGGGGGGDGGASRPLRVSFRGSFAQSLTPQCIAAAAVCLLNQQQQGAQQGAQQQQQQQQPPPPPPPPPPPTRRRASRVLTPAQALMQTPPGCASFLDMLRARHGLVIEEEELEA